MERGPVPGVAEQLEAHTKLLNALRETQIEHDDKLGRIDGRLDGLETRTDGLEGRMDGLDDRMGNLEGRMDSLEGRFDRRENTVTDGFAKVSADMAKVMELLAA